MTVRCAILDDYQGRGADGRLIVRTVPGVLATPHLGYVTARNYRTYFREAVEDIAAYLAGAPIRRLT